MRRVGPLLLCALVLGAGTLLARADELPTRKAGLWEIKMPTTPPLPAMVMQQCTDESTDKQMSTMFGPAQKEACARNDIQKTATGYIVDSSCNLGSVATTSHLEINGDFQSAYTVQVSTKVAGGPKAVPPEKTLTIEAKWLGACKVDQKPGDIIMPGGMKMNVKELEALRAMTKKP